MRLRLVWAALAGAALAAPAAARAQDVGDIALEQLEPTPAGDAFFGVPSPFIGGHLVPGAHVLVAHAADPLVLSAEQTGGAEAGAVVGGQTLLHAVLSLALWDRLLADLHLPLVLAQSGDDPAALGAVFTSPSAAAVGDLRFGVRIRVFGDEAGPFQIAPGVRIHFPTGISGAYAGEGAFRESLYLALGGHAPYFVWSASFGATIRGSDNPSTWNWGAGAALVLAGGLVQVGPELFAATPLQEGYLRPQNARSIPRDRVTNAELLLGARVRLPLGFKVGAGGGLGLSDAIGTPAFRIVGSVAWALPFVATEGDPVEVEGGGTADGPAAAPP